MPRRSFGLSLQAMLLFCFSCASAPGLLVDNFKSNGGVTEPSLGLVSTGATGPTNKLFTGLGTNAIGDRTISVEVPAGVPAGGYAYVEPTGAGTALVYNSGSVPGGFSLHGIAWSAGNFDLLTAVGVFSPDEMFFRLDFGENNFPLSAIQIFEISVTSGGGSALYSATVASNSLAGSTDFSALLSHQSGAFDSNNVSILLRTELPFAGANNQFELTGVSVVPEPATFALLASAALLLAVVVLSRRKSG